MKKILIISLALLSLVFGKMKVDEILPLSPNTVVSINCGLVVTSSITANSINLSSTDPDSLKTAGGASMAGNLVITNTNDNPVFNYTATYDDSGAIIQNITRTQASIVNGWDLYNLAVYGNNSAATNVQYAGILIDAISTTAGSHQGRTFFQNANAGAMANYLTATGINCVFSGKIETTSTASDSLKTAGGGQFGGNVTVGGKILRGVNNSYAIDLGVANNAIRIGTTDDSYSAVRIKHDQGELIVGVDDSAGTVIGEASDSFVWAAGNRDLHLGTNNTKRFTLAGVNGAATFAGAGTFGGDVTVGGDLYVTNSDTPASAGATGTVGQIAWDADYIYVCTATNTWKRAAISTW